LSLKQADLFHHLEVLGDRGLGQIELLHDFPANTGISASEESKNADPSRVAERSCEGGQLDVGLRSLERSKVGGAIVFGAAGGTFFFHRSSTICDETVAAATPDRE